MAMALIEHMCPLFMIGYFMSSKAVVSKPSLSPSLKKIGRKSPSIILQGSLKRLGTLEAFWRPWIKGKPLSTSKTILL